MCSLIKTCTVGAPAATQPPKKISEQEFNAVETIYKHKNSTNTNRLQTQPSRIQASKQQQEIPRFVMRAGLTGC